MAPLLTRKRVIQVKLEGTKGTAETSGFTDLSVMDDPTINPTATWAERKGSGKFLGHQAPGVVTEQTGEISLQTELRGNGSTGLDAGLAVLLQCCGMNLSTLTYAPVSTDSDQNTCTIRGYIDGNLKVLYGAAGTFDVEGEWGKRIFINFTFSGIWGAPDQVELPTESKNTALPMMLRGATFTHASRAMKVSKIGMSPNNEVAPRHDIAASSGIAYFHVIDRDPTITMDPEEELQETYDYYAAWLAGTEAAFSLLVTDSTTNVTLTAPKVQYRELAEGDRDGKVVNEVTGQCNFDSGNDEFTIVTAAVA